MASRCNTALVDPPNAITTAIEFSKAFFVIISLGLISRSSNFFIAAPASLQSCFLSLETASWLLLPGKLIPRASILDAIVLAVYIPPQDPGPFTETFSTAISSSSLMLPFANSPTFSQTVT